MTTAPLAAHSHMARSKQNMDAALLIERLVTLEHAAGYAGQTEMRDFVIEAQDCVLRLQEEILRLRRENLRLHGPFERYRWVASGEAMPAPGPLSPTKFAA